MNSAIIHSESKNDLDLLLKLAQKLGVKSHKLSREEMEDFGLSLAIAQGTTGEYVDTDQFLESLGNGSKDKFFPKR